LGYDSGKHSTEPDRYYVMYEDEPQSEGCVALTVIDELIPVEGYIVVTDDP
jgi:hypothetical protein